MDFIERPRDREIVSRACEILLRIPGVFSVGLGHKLVNGVSTGRLAFSIMVLEKKPVASLAPHEVIPTEIEGLPTDVIEGSPPQLIAEEPEDFDPGVPRDRDEYRPILGGIQIRGQRSITDTGAHTFGTLGGFATTTGKDAGQRVLLTNHHVLDDRDGYLHGPSCTGCTKGDGVGNPDSGSQVATILRGRDDDEVDAAIAILDQGVQFQRDIVKDDEPGRREAIGASRPVDTSDIGKVVHKRGMRTRVTYGIIGAVCCETTPPVSGGRQRTNQIRIDLARKMGPVNVPITFEAGNRILVPSVDFTAGNVQVNDVVFLEAAVNSGRYRIETVVDANRLALQSAAALTQGTIAHTLSVTPPLFALNGDSGSLLLDENRRVVGLVWAAFSKRMLGNAWANRIDRVEELLRIKIDAATAVGDTQVALAAPRDTNPPAGDDSRQPSPLVGPGGTSRPPVVELRTVVEGDLQTSPRGAEIYQLYFTHHTEVRELIDGNREVALVWHRQSGPGMIQMVLDAVRSRATPIPSRVRGRSWGERVNAILAVLAHFGSNRLRDDIARFGHDIQTLGGMTYPRFLETLKA